MEKVPWDIGGGWGCRGGLVVCVTVQNSIVLRAQLTKRFSKRSVLPESSCLHYLLPERREASVTDRLHRARTFEPLTIRTVKYRKSFIPYRLSNFV